MGKLDNIISGIACGAILAIIGTLGFQFYKATEQDSKRNRVEYILDTNRDEQLSSDEIKRFYDETETTPYTKQSLINAPCEDLDKFLDKYKEK